MVAHSAGPEQRTEADPAGLPAASRQAAGTLSAAVGHPGVPKALTAGKTTDFRRAPCAAASGRPVIRGERHETLRDLWK